MGFCHVSSILTLVIYSGDPYPNGRNQESSAEAIAAYEAVALYGLGASSVFGDSDDPADKVGPVIFFAIFENAIRRSLCKILLFVT
jgi:hypothetical protein